jgi:hypothetical protein
MPKIINSYRGSGLGPMGEMLQSLGRSRQQSDPLGDELKRQKIYEMQRQNTETEEMMKILGLFGKPGENIPANAAGAAMFGAGIDPSKLADYDRWRNYQQGGADSPAAVNSTLGAGGAYSSTKPAFDTTMAETQRQFNMKPQPALDAQGNPVFGRQGDLSGLQPILNNSERQGTAAGQHFGQMGELPQAERNYIGAAGPAGTPRNYILRDGRSFITHDGQTDSQTGQPLPPGGYIGNVEGDAGAVGLTNAVRTDLQSKRIAYDQFNALADHADELLSDPTRFGLTGAVRSIGQEIGQLGQNAAQLLGAGTISEAAQKVASTLSASGVDPNLVFGGYDTGLPEVDTVWGLIVYSGASALAGQENRSVSDKDIAIMREILGDPKAILSSAPALKAKIDAARRIISSRQAVVDRYLGGQGGAQPAAPVAPAPGAPAPAQMQPAAPATPRIRLNNEGEVIQ